MPPRLKAFPPTLHLEVIWDIYVKPSFTRTLPNIKTIVLGRATVYPQTFFLRLIIINFSNHNHGQSVEGKL